MRNVPGQVIELRPSQEVTREAQGIPLNGSSVSRDAISLDAIPHTNRALLSLKATITRDAVLDAARKFKVEERFDALREHVQKLPLQLGMKDLEVIMDVARGIFSETISHLIRKAHVRTHFSSALNQAEHSRDYLKMLETAQVIKGHITGECRGLFQIAHFILSDLNPSPQGSAEKKMRVLSTLTIAYDEALDECLSLIDNGDTRLQKARDSLSTQSDRAVGLYDPQLENELLGREPNALTSLIEKTTPGGRLINRGNTSGYNSGMKKGGGATLPSNNKPNEHILTFAA